MAMRKNVNFFNMSNVTLHNDGNTFLIVSCHPLKKSGCNELWFFNVTVLMYIHIRRKTSLYISFSVHLSIYCSTGKYLLILSVKCILIFQVDSSVNCRFFGLVIFVNVITHNVCLVVYRIHCQNQGVFLYDEI